MLANSISRIAYSIFSFKLKNDKPRGSSPLRFNKRNPKGFTLIELLLAISIIGLLTAISVVTFRSSQSSARDAQRKTDLKSVAASLERYRARETDPGIGKLRQIYPLSTWQPCPTNSSWSCSNSSNPDNWIQNLAPTYIQKMPIERKQEVGEPCGVETTWVRAEYVYGYYAPVGNQFVLTAKLEDENDKDGGNTVTISEQDGSVRTLNIKGCYIIGSP